MPRRRSGPSTSSRRRSPPSSSSSTLPPYESDEYTSTLAVSPRRASRNYAPSFFDKSARIVANPVILASKPTTPDIADSDLSDDSDHSPTTVVHAASRKGRIPYITATTAAVKTDNDESAALPEEATPLIRRRRRIGRPFTASSPIGWNEDYLTSPVSPRNKDDEDDDCEFRNLNDAHQDVIGIPMLGLKDESPQEIRRRRGADNASRVSTDQNAAASAITADGDDKSRSKKSKASQPMSFSAFRINYLIVHIAIMLADGLQGTHLYVLYEGYGYSVASLYCLGFVSGAITSPFIGPFVDKIGRKKSAMLYCSLEMFINWLEQFPYFYGLIVSRIIGGITTNLLFSVFESWLVTEHRRRGYAEDKLETILRDSVILSNLAAIASGFFAEFLAVKFGPVGPFEGAVTCTGIALLLVFTMWRENYGSDVPGVKSVRGYMAGAFKTIVSDTNISRIGLIQGLTEGSLQTFVFLWSPALARFAVNSPSTAIGLDGNGEPAYGLIFGAFMACGVGGGLSEPYIRKVATNLVRDHDRRAGFRRRDTVIIDGEGEVKPAAVEFMATAVYLSCAGLLLIPYLLPADGEYSFIISLFAFLLYEFMVGLYMPCEGVIRSIYMPMSSVCSVMTMLRVIVNIAVALGVISTNYVPFATAFAAVSTLMLISAGIQLSMVDTKEWKNFVRRVSSIHTSPGDNKASIDGLRMPLKSITEFAPSPPVAMSVNDSFSSNPDEKLSDDEIVVG